MPGYLHPLTAARAIGLLVGVKLGELEPAAALEQLLAVLGTDPDLATDPSLVQADPGPATRQSGLQRLRDAILGRRRVAGGRLSA